MHWKQLKGSHKFAAHRHTLSRVQSIVRPVPELSAKRPLNTVALVANWTIGGTVGPVRESGNWWKVGGEVKGRRSVIENGSCQLHWLLMGLSPLFQAIILANFLWQFSYRAEIKCDELRGWLAVFKESDLMVIKRILWQNLDGQRGWLLNEDRNRDRYFWLSERYFGRKSMFQIENLYVVVISINFYLYKFLICKIMYFLVDYTPKSLTFWAFYACLQSATTNIPMYHTRAKPKKQKQNRKVKAP